jgi:type II secretory pathway component PulJ
MHAWRTADGVSLAELLVSLAILGLVLACVFGALDGALRAYGWGARRVEAQQSARLALERMASELREAGYDPAGVGVDPIIVAAPALVTVQRDLDGDGVIDAGRERVTFLLRPGETTLRRDAGGGAQPIIDGVQRFRLTYLDRAGRPASLPSEVASVRIDLAVGAGGPVALLQTDVSLRNRRR